WDVNLAAAEKKAEDISLNGGNAAAVECDVLDKTSAVKALNSTISLYGTVGILINGAGGSYNLRPDRFF
ncbi:MAG TPA: SDR family NAD(P)-dependent oxidoreductase, partial [Spirochaetes bacterium]|nr:SDR family NAD(P)-dependent oxidoreductase [Spirochaetota bacterium]